MGRVETREEREINGVMYCSVNTIWGHGLVRVRESTAVNSRNTLSFLGELPKKPSFSSLLCLLHIYKCRGFTHKHEAFTSTPKYALHLPTMRKTELSCKTALFHTDLLTKPSLKSTQMQSRNKSLMSLTSHAHTGCVHNGTLYT